MSIDSMEIEVLADGTVKVTTDPISPANHMSCEQFLAFMARNLGGEVTTTRRRESHRHVHRGVEVSLGEIE